MRSDALRPGSLPQRPAAVRTSTSMRMDRNRHRVHASREDGMQQEGGSFGLRRRPLRVSRHTALQRFTTLVTQSDSLAANFPSRNPAHRVLNEQPEVLQCCITLSYFLSLG